MGTQAWPGSGTRPWRARLRKLLHDLGADEWEEPATGSSDPDRGETSHGAQAVLDEVLREASEKRQSHPDDAGST